MAGQTHQGDTFLLAAPATDGRAIHRKGGHASVSMTKQSCQLSMRVAEYNHSMIQSSVGNLVKPICQQVRKSLPAYPASDLRTTSWGSWQDSGYIANRACANCVKPISPPIMELLSAAPASGPIRSTPRTIGQDHGSTSKQVCDDFVKQTNQQIDGCTSKQACDDFVKQINQQIGQSMPATCASGLRSTPEAIGCDDVSMIVQYRGCSASPASGDRSIYRVIAQDERSMAREACGNSLNSIIQPAQASLPLSSATVLRATPRAVGQDNGFITKQPCESSAVIQRVRKSLPASSASCLRSTPRLIQQDSRAAERSTPQAIGEDHGSTAKQPCESSAVIQSLRKSLPCSKSTPRSMKHDSSAAESHQGNAASSRVTISALPFSSQRGGRTSTAQGSPGKLGQEKFSARKQQTNFTYSAMTAVPASDREGHTTVMGRSKILPVHATPPLPLSAMQFKSSPLVSWRAISPQGHAVVHGCLANAPERTSPAVSRRLTPQVSHQTTGLKYLIETLGQDQSLAHGLRGHGGCSAVNVVRAVSPPAPPRSPTRPPVDEVFASSPAAERNCKTSCEVEGHHEVEMASAKPGVLSTSVRQFSNPAICGQPGSEAPGCAAHDGRLNTLQAKSSIKRSQAPQTSRVPSLRALEKPQARGSPCEVLPATIPRVNASKLSVLSRSVSCESKAESLRAAHPNCAGTHSLVRQRSVPATYGWIRPLEEACSHSAVIRQPSHPSMLSASAVESLRAQLPNHCLDAAPFARPRQRSFDSERTRSPSFATSPATVAASPMPIPAQPIDDVRAFFLPSIETCSETTPFSICSGTDTRSPPHGNASMTIATPATADKVAVDHRASGSVALSPCDHSGENEQIDELLTKALEASVHFWVKQDDLSPAETVPNDSINTQTPILSDSYSNISPSTCSADSDQQAGNVAVDALRTAATITPASVHGCCFDEAKMVFAPSVECTR